MDEDVNIPIPTRHEQFMTQELKRDVRKVRIEYHYNVFKITDNLRKAKSFKFAHNRIWLKDVADMKRKPIFISPKEPPVVKDLKYYFANAYFDKVKDSGVTHVSVCSEKGKFILPDHVTLTTGGTYMIGYDLETQKKQIKHVFGNKVNSPLFSKTQSDKHGKRIRFT
eukprot:223005_1